MGQVPLDPTRGANAKKAFRRGLSEEHVHANLKACEQTVQKFMDKHADEEPGGGAVMQMTLGETSNTASDVRDRLIDFLDKTVGKTVRGKSSGKDRKSMSVGHTLRDDRRTIHIDTLKPKP